MLSCELDAGGRGCGQKLIYSPCEALSGSSHIEGRCGCLHLDFVNSGDRFLSCCSRFRYIALYHWIGKINHLLDRLCNLKLTGTGKLVQTREIAAGHVLTFDYGVDYWVYQLSGLELSEWCAGSSVACSRGTQDLFRRMHQNVQDYTDLLCHWVKRRSILSSELERETWMGDLAEYLEVRSW